MTRGDILVDVSCQLARTLWRAADVKGKKAEMELKREKERTSGKKSEPHDVLINLFIFVALSFCFLFVFLFPPFFPFLFFTWLRINLRFVSFFSKIAKLISFAKSASHKKKRKERKKCGENSRFLFFQ
jgi:hypothetical protein